MTDSNLGSFTGVGVNKKFTEPVSEPFTGIVVADEIVPNTYSDDGVQWHFAVRPLEYALGNTGCYHEKANNSDSPGSKLAHYLTGHKKYKGSGFSNSLQPADLGKLEQIGEGKLVGVVCRFQRVNIQYGPQEVRITLPMGKATPEQIAAATSLAPLPADVSWLHEGSTPAAYQPPPAVEFDPATLEKMAEALNGKSRVEQMILAGSEGGDLGAAIADGSLITQLVQAGLGDVDPAGTFTAR